ncbi:unnamed protein product [Blepharisma stoltei]|uniref:SAM-dependent methyltransferase n=1 Tax=Blepharisma stoltei TaxID=1481888 RepID=A0AAU9KKB0_9CILI|nr:unnamed protein product [Blepharisma stoltei]
MKTKNKLNKMSSIDYAFQNYNEYSSPALTVMMRMSNAFQEALSKARTLDSSTITIADYGSSECLNSMLFIKHALTPFRETSQQPILIYHNDLPTNSWSKAFKTILEHQDSYINLPNVYFSSVGRTFFEQILPDNSVTIGISSISFHFLSEDLSAPDHVLASSSNDLEFKEKAAKFAHDDLINLLELRYKELVDHGTLILQFAGETMDFGQYLQDANERLYEKGIVTEEEKTSLSAASYGRTTEEVQRALDQEREKFRVLYFNKEKVPMFTGKSEKHIEIFTGMSKMVVGFQLQKTIKRTEEERNEILKQYVDEMKDLFEAKDQQLFTDLYIVALEKISRDK